MIGQTNKNISPIVRIQVTWDHDQCWTNMVNNKESV